MRDVAPLGPLVWARPGSAPPVGRTLELPVLPVPVAPTALWPHQVQALGLLYAAWALYRAILLASPTGSGKTIIASAVIERELGQGGRVLFVAPRRELVEQCVAKLRAVGICPGVLMAGDKADGLGLGAPVQVASLGTI